MVRIFLEHENPAALCPQGLPSLFKRFFIQRLSRNGYFVHNICNSGTHKHWCRRYLVRRPYRCSRRIPFDATDTLSIIFVILIRIRIGINVVYNEIPALIGTVFGGAPVINIRAHLLPTSCRNFSSGRECGKAVKIRTVIVRRSGVVPPGQGLEWLASYGASS